MTPHELLARVREAEGPDRELDWDIQQSLFGIEATDFHGTPRYTASIDAIVALIERKLPGWAWKLGTCSVSDDAWLVPDFNSPIHGERLREQFNYAGLEAGSIWDTGIDVDRRPPGHPALAMCEAFLSAIASNGDGE